MSHRVTFNTHISRRLDISAILFRIPESCANSSSLKDLCKEKKLNYLFQISILGNASKKNSMKQYVL